MVRWAKRLLLGLAICWLRAGGRAVDFRVSKYRKYKRTTDAFDLAELDKIPAISKSLIMRGCATAGWQERRVTWCPSQDLPRFHQGPLAREDSRFYQHQGVDFQGIARAAFRNLNAGDVKEGASTITQQLARNTFSLGDDRWRRKLLEALLALRIESNLGKDKILEAYANRIYYGSGLYGVETASRACFGKSASDLTLSEAAILAGLIRSPNRLSPLEDTQTALAQRDRSDAHGGAENDYSRPRPRRLPESRCRSANVCFRAPRRITQWTP